MNTALCSLWPAKLLIAAWALWPIPWGRGTRPEAASTTQPAVAESQPAPETQPAAPAPEEPATIKPRFELHVPSLHHLVREARRSHTGPLAEHLGGMLMEMGRASSEGVSVDQAAALLTQMKSWPDTALDAVNYAPDNEGRPRWAVRLAWPVDDLYARLQPLLSLEAAATILQGVRLAPRPEGGYTLALPAATLAYLLPAGSGQAVVASHPDLEFPATLFQGTEETAQDGPPLLVCRLNLKGTEKDTGATFWSSFAAITNVTYDGRVNPDGEWVESVRVYWPPIVGTAAKAALAGVKQTFFVPDEAYGSVVLSPRMAPSMLESMAGFGPQMMMGDSGEITMVRDTEVGPIASNIGSEMCASLLPGTGFMPVPDLVFQLKAKRADKLIEDLREATRQINRVQREREQPEPWHEAEIRDRPVFWSDGSTARGGMMVPAVMRPVLFVAKEIDAKDREREFLVLGLTSTSPERLVRRWIEMPRAKARRFLPTESKTDGQMWINWRQAYRWIQPYLNVALSAVSRDLLLPRAKDMADGLTDASFTLDVKYGGLSVAHRGPMPVGVLAVPVLFGIATSLDETSGSDLARERLACRRLKVIYHHARLFKQDLGRWPAELAELDGYIDFAGHPEVLRLELSSKHQRKEWLEGLLGASDEKKEKEEEEEEDELTKLDDRLFVIEWGRESWTLGIAPGTFEHLEKLYIDQDGDIHRVERKPEK
ncbi:MAG: hypothetical protein V2A79_03930 [Planctomycetota bacterium]